MFNPLKLGLLPFRIGKVSTGLLIFLAQVFVWISADWVFGAQAAVAREIMLIYFLLFLVTRVSLGSTPSTMKVKEEGLLNFLLMFTVTAGILLVVSIVAPLAGVFAGGMELTLGAVTVSVLGFGILHAFIKAYIEEDVFRDALPRAGLGDVLSNVIFALFHLSVFFTVYNFGMVQAVTGAVTLFVLGMVWSQVRNNFGIMGSTASHTVWNIFAMGALSMLAGGMVI